METLIELLNRTKVTNTHTIFHNIHQTISKRKTRKFQSDFLNAEVHIFQFSLSFTNAVKFLNRQPIIFLEIRIFFNILQ